MKHLNGIAAEHPALSAGTRLREAVPARDHADWERGIILSRMVELERENDELRRANEILRRAAAYFTGAGSPRR